MFSAFGDLITQWAAWLRQLVPIKIVNVYEQGVRFRNGNPTGLLTSENGLRGGGMHFFWPCIGEIITKTVTLRVNECQLQSLPTADGVDATVSIGLRWTIRDLLLMWTKVHDGEATVTDVVSGAAGQVIPTLDWADLPTKLGPAIEAAVRKGTRGWGVEIHAVYIMNLAKAPGLRLFADAHNPLSALLQKE